MNLIPEEAVCLHTPVPKNKTMKTNILILLALAFAGCEKVKHQKNKAKEELRHTTEEVSEEARHAANKAAEEARHKYEEGKKATK